MDQRLKSFIENRIDLIDQGKFVEFFNSASMVFFDSKVKMLVEILDEAGIDTRMYREIVFIENALERLQDSVHIHKFGAGFTVRVRDFIDNMGFEFFGFNLEEAITLFIKHIDEFDPYVDLEKTAHEYLVRIKA